MDTLTQGLLGATFGQAGFAHRLGRRRAVWWGALGGVLPDLDTVIVPFFGPLAEWRHHRSLTHALWFGPLVGAALGYLVWRRHARRRAAMAARDPAGPDPGARSALAWWMGLFAVAIVTHPLLDLFTTYGTQLLWPFSRRRFAIDAVAIIDPLYTLVLVAALAAGAARPDRSRHSRLAAGAALFLTTAYLFYGQRLNGQLEAEARRQLTPAWEVHAYPTLLQPWLRRVVARRPGEVRVGFATTLATGPIAWSSFAPDEGPAVDAVRAQPEGRLFDWFAMGQTAAAVLPQGARTTVEIDDLRYGFPGEPRHGLWGIRAAVGPSGRLEGPVEPFRRPRPRGLLAWLWRATFPG